MKQNMQDQYNKKTAQVTKYTNLVENLEPTFHIRLHLKFISPSRQSLSLGMVAFSSSNLTGVEAVEEGGSAFAALETLVEVAALVA